MDNEAFFRAGLDELKAAGNLRALPQVEHDGRYVSASGRRMLNLSSNDYLGIASEGLWQREFLAGLSGGEFLPCLLGRVLRPMSHTPVI